MLASRLRWVADPLDSTAWWAVASMACVVVLAAFEAARPIPSLEARALLLDRVLGTDEAVATAVGLRGGEAPVEFLEALRGRLADEVDPDDPRLVSGLPFRTPPRTGLLPVLAAAVVCVGLLPPFGDAPRTAPSSDPFSEAERLAERKQALEQEFGTVLPEEIDQAFEDVLEALRRGETGREDAAKKAVELERKLAALANSGADGAAGDFQQAEEALGDVDGEAAQDLADAAKEGDLAAAAAAVDRMRERMRAREPRQREEAAAALKKAAAAAAAAGREELAGALEKEAARTEGAASDGRSSDQGSGSQGQDSAPGEQDSGTSRQAEATGGRSGDAPEQGAGSQGPQEDPKRQGSGGGLAEYLRELQAKGVEGRLGEEARRRAMAERMQGALRGTNPYAAADGRPGGVGGAGEREGRGGWGAGRSHTDEAGESRPEGAEHQNRNRQVDGSHRDWVTEFGQEHVEDRMEGIQAVTQTVEVPVGEGPVDVEFMRRTGGDEASGRALIQAPAGYREAAAEAIDGEGVPRVYRDQIKTYFDAID